jgi:TPR repeat protein
MCSFVYAPLALCSIGTNEAILGKWEWKARNSGLQPSRRLLRFSKPKNPYMACVKAVQNWRKATLLCAVLFATSRVPALGQLSDVEKQWLAYFKTKAEAGEAQAQCNLGAFYEKGEFGLTNDAAEAVKWYRKAADQGLAQAQWSLGECYRNGTGLTKDLSEAMRWYRKAADQGDAGCQVMLGAACAHGDGVPKDYGEAVNWFRKAAEQGFPAAQDELGKSYYRGEGVSQDFTEAAKWFLKAADQGYKGAQGNLGGCYLRGEGVTKDYVQAYKWLNLASARGDQKARKALSSLESVMTAEQVAEAQRLSREFKAKASEEILRLERELRDIGGIQMKGKTNE